MNKQEQKYRGDSLIKKLAIEKLITMANTYNDDDFLFKLCGLAGDLYSYKANNPKKI